MIHTLIICLSIVAIVIAICYTSYKSQTYVTDTKVLKDIHKELYWLKATFSDDLENIQREIRESNDCLQKIRINHDT